MKITVYTTPDCTFSASEKTYLQSRNLPFEEKNVKDGEAILTEMLKVGNNFAGTPVTKIVKDDGTEVVLKGFTQSEFDEALAPKKDAAPTQAPAASEQTPPPAAPTQEAQPTPPVGIAEPPPMPAAPTMPQVNVVPPVAPVAPAMPAEQPAQAPQAVNPLDSILRDLQNKVAQESAAAAPAQQTPAAPAAGGTLPSVPDFGAK